MLMMGMSVALLRVLARRRLDETCCIRGTCRPAMCTIVMIRGFHRHRCTSWPRPPASTNVTPSPLDPPRLMTATILSPILTAPSLSHHRLPLLVSLQRPFHWILNTAIGGDWPGPPNATTVWPQLHLIDYVRWYTWSGQ